MTMEKTLTASDCSAGQEECVRDMYSGFFGDVYRMYFCTTLPTSLTAGGSVATLISYNILYTDSSGNQGVACGSAGSTSDAVVTQKEGNLSMTTGTGITVVSGYIDYVKAA